VREREGERRGREMEFIIMTIKRYFIVKIGNTE